MSKPKIMAQPSRRPCRGFLSRAFVAAALAGVMFAGSSARSEAQTSAGPTEYELKGAFLLNFARFIEWPPEAFPSDKTAFSICVFGADPFGAALDEIARGKTINSRELIIRRLIKPAEVRTCQLVFVGDADSKRLPELLEVLKGTSALVVGEIDGFAQRGGGMQFFLENGKVRFLVNVDAVQRAGLKVSSKLLALAQIVHDETHSKGD